MKQEIRSKISALKREKLTAVEKSDYKRASEIDAEIEALQASDVEGQFWEWKHFETAARQHGLTVEIVGNQDIYYDRDGIMHDASERSRINTYLQLKGFRGPTRDKELDYLITRWRMRDGDIIPIDKKQAYPTVFSDLCEANWVPGVEPDWLILFGERWNLSFVDPIFAQIVKKWFYSMYLCDKYRAEITSGKFAESLGDSWAPPMLVLGSHEANRGKSEFFSYFNRMTKTIPCKVAISNLVDPNERTKSLWVKKSFLNIFEEVIFPSGRDLAAWKDFMLSRVKPTAKMHTQVATGGDYICAAFGGTVQTNRPFWMDDEGIFRRYIIIDTTKSLPPNDTYYERFKAFIYQVAYEANKVFEANGFDLKKVTSLNQEQNEYLKATNREYFSKILSAEQTLAIMEAWDTYQDIDKIINFLVGFTNKGLFRDYTLNELKKLVINNKPSKMEDAHV